MLKFLNILPAFRSYRLSGYTLLIFILLGSMPCNSCFRTTEIDSFPILVLGTDSGFGSFTCEILKAEGFNEFLYDSSGSEKITSEYLRKFDLVILGETRVNNFEKTSLSDYVKAGGNLIAMRPDSVLHEMFGLSATGHTIREAYLAIDTTVVFGKGLIGESIQFHGSSDLYLLSGGKKIASLFYNQNDSSEYPAVVVNDFGKGHTAAFSYNLSKSIVYTRQGNPDWAGEERDKIDGPTATDLFYPEGNEIQWNNPLKIAIPQADEQMRLLSHIIERFSTFKKPVPRFWYFPDQYKCIFIFTIDGEDTPERDIDKEFADVLSKGGNATLYEIGTYINTATVTRWRSEGHEVAIHYNDVPNYSEPTYCNMNIVFDTMTANFRNAYGILPKTVRNHWVVWCSRDSTGRKQFAEQAAIEEKYGLGLDCNYYQFGGNKVYPNWIGDVGHFTGSGIPMKFADTSGRILQIYQSNTQLPDETWLKENIESKSKTLIDRSLDEENYTYINANFHTWYWTECREPGMRVLDYCIKRGVPVRTAERVYEFLKMKDEAFFTDINWSENQLTFKIQSTLQNPDGLTFLLPANHAGSKIISIRSDGNELKYNTEKIKGYEYAMATIAPGKIHDISADYR